MSQLDLSLAAGVSTRHVSFVESGRSSPSREMVLRLAETLELPLRTRNDLLRLAGFAPAFPERGLEEPELATVRAIIEQMLNKHEPYPAFVLDRMWNIVRANPSAERLFASALAPEASGASGASGVAEQGSVHATEVNAIEVFLGPGVFRDIVENWEEVAWVTLSRLRREAAAGHDEELHALLARAESFLGDRKPPANLDIHAPTVAPRLRFGDQVISTISTIASFTAARDVTLEELRVELIYPADDAAERFFHALAGCARSE